MKLFFTLAFLLAPLTASAYESAAKQAYIVDVATGTELYNKNADERMPPSSMSKLMTAYVVFKHIHEGSVKLTDQFTVSEKAWRTGGSKMFIHVGDYVKLEDLLRGMIIQSGNDACVAIAEGIAGSETAYAEEMNKVAAEIGLKGSHFVNATGLPDPEHYMTAHDLAILARAILRDFPEFHHYYSETEFTYNNIKQGNRNPLLYNNTLGVDGMKTGHTDLAGYGITLSGQNPRDGRRIIAVINGLPSMQARADEARAIVTYAYMGFENLQVTKKGDTLDEVPVWMGNALSVPVGVDEELLLTLPRGQGAHVKATVHADGPVLAPITVGQKVATLTIELPGQPARQVPLVALKSVDKLYGFERLMPNLNHLLFDRGAAK